MNLPPPFYVCGTPEPKILVTESYENMFCRLLHLREDYYGCSTGAVLTGQPGTGESLTRCPPRATTHSHSFPPVKTAFLKFMLVRLISAHQVVIFCDGNNSYLFYGGKVFFQSMKHYPVWALIDMDHTGKAPPISNFETNIWPIQASSLEPALWKRWSKRYRATRLGMPRWSVEDLSKGYIFNFSSLSAINPRYGYSMEVHR